MLAKTKTREDLTREPRQPLDYPCWLDRGPGLLPFECRLIDVSRSGARLRCALPHRLPDVFSLYLTRNGKVGRRCKVLHRNGNEIGLQFIGREVPLPQWAHSEPDALIVEI